MKTREGDSPHSRKRLLVVSSSIIVLIGIFFIGWWLRQRKAPLSPLLPDVGIQDTGSLEDLKKLSESFRMITKRVGPAVVNIQATQRTGTERRRTPRGAPHENPFEGDGFFEFFREFGVPFGMPPEGPKESLGSGILIDSQGTLVTNYHVVRDATEIVVTLSDDKTELKAKRIGFDERSDLAVLKVGNVTQYTFAEWADSDSVEVGDWAIAIGSPFALGQSVTLGIVSAKGRMPDDLDPNFSSELIQTDAAINPGNSGGPLCDVHGKVIGVNTAIYTRSGGYMGIGFAIPSNLVKEVARRLAAGEKIVHGWLGVQIQDLDSDLKKELGIQGGVFVNEVLDGSPAAKAGIRAGDILVEMDGKGIQNGRDLQNRINQMKPGNTTRFKVVAYSTKQFRTVQAQIRAAPEQNETEKEEMKESVDRKRAD